MASKLKAYVRFDGSGRVVPSSLILQRNKPKVGNWHQINSTECCKNTECSAPVYVTDWIIDGITEVPGGLIFDILTNPFENYTMQVQFVSCITGKGIGDIATVGPENNYTLAWFVPQDILDAGCAIQVRHVCSQDLISDWYLFND
tara:strand:+ start:723 stop:1157 length:435 start_codon:yes stop_codon:yes gene_type:complete